LPYLPPPGAARLERKRVGFLVLGEKLSEKLGNRLAGGGWLGIMRGETAALKRHRKIEGNKQGVC